MLIMLRALSFLNYAGKHLINVITNERLFIMELLQTAQGGNKLVYNGNTYIIKKKNIGSIRWVCTRKFKTGCSGAVTTDDPMGNPRKETPHIHFPDETRVEVEKFRNGIKEAARRNHGAKTANILVDGVQTLSPEAALAIPQFDTLKRDIQRQKAKNRPLEPQSILDVIINHPWGTTGGIRPVPFLIYDSGMASGYNRVLVFAADDAISHLSPPNHA